MRPGNGEVQCTDATSLGLDDSWFYSWGVSESTNHNNDETKCAHEGTRVAREFVPMIINCDDVDGVWENIDSYKQKWEALNVKFILGYNEPDGSHQTCSPQLGAEKWVTVQKIQLLRSTSSSWLTLTVQWLWKFVSRGRDLFWEFPVVKPILWEL